MIELSKSGCVPGTSTSRTLASHEDRAWIVPACSRGMPRIVASSTVTALSCEAILVHDTAPAVVTIKPHNRTLDHDRTDRPEEGCQPGFNVGSPSSMCPNTSSKCPEASAARIGPNLRTYGYLINSLCTGLAVRNAGSGCLRAPRQ